MKKFDISDADLADKVDVNRTTVTRWRTGERSPKLEKLPEIASIFGVPATIFVDTPELENKPRNQIIASNIKKYVSLNNITQKELADAIKISPSTMSDYMNLRSNPSYGVIQKIADYFGILKSDIDTTFKDPIKDDILSVYEKLDTDHQSKVYDFAKEQLADQQHAAEDQGSTYAIDDPALTSEQDSLSEKDK